MTTIRFDKVSKFYANGVKALEDFNLEIASGEFITVIGPSGCGKSTLLKLAAGLEEVSSGSIYRGTKNLASTPANQRNVAMMFQNYVLFPHMNIYQNISFGLKLRKTPPQEIQNKVQEISSLLSITELLERFPHQISGGQRQRAALARAVLRNPDMFLLDEPLSNIDTALRGSMRKEIKNIHQRLKKPFLYVTHDQSEALTLGDRVVVLKEGKIQQVDSPLNIYHKPANIFVAEFMGHTPINIIEGHLKKSSQGLIFKGPGFETQLKITRPTQAPDEKVFLGIRPENFSLVSDASTSRPEDLRGIIESIEPMGWQSNFEIKFGNIHFNLTLDNDTSFKKGDEITFQLNSDKLLLFDHNKNRIDL